MSQVKPTGWVGWIYFAGAMMLMVGLMGIIDGLVAVFNTDYYLVSQNSILGINYTTWGWVQVLIGFLILSAGYAIFSGKAWGRIVAVVMAVLSALAHFAFISAYPIWS